MKNISTLILIFFITIQSWSQVGTPDLSFGNRGVVTTGKAITGNNGFESTKKCFVQPDGKLLLVVDIGGKAVIIRRMANGDRDITFGHNGYSNPIDVSNPSAAMQVDGKIVVAGGAQNSPDFLVARFNSDGTADAGFGHNGLTVTDGGYDDEVLSSVAIGTDGKIYAGGGSGNGVITHFAVLRYTSTGQPDASFGQNGIAITNINDQSCFISAIAISADGKLIAVGQLTGNDAGDYALARYNTDGTPDLSFHGTGYVTTSFTAYDLAIAITTSSDGKIYIGGYDSETGPQHSRVTRYNTDGSIDLSYNNGTGTSILMFGDSNDALTNLLLLPDGKLLVAGEIDLHTATGYDIELVRLNNNGTVDTDFGTAGIVTSDINSSNDVNNMLSTDANGNIFTGGYTISISGDYSLFKYSSDGVPDQSFGSGGGITDFVPYGSFSYSAIYAQPDGKLVAASSFYDGTVTYYLSRFNSNGTPDNTYGQNGTTVVNSGTLIFQPDGKSFAFPVATPDNTGNFSFSRNNVDGSPDLTFGTGGNVNSDFGGNEYVGTLALQPDGKIIVTGFQYADVGSHLVVARYNTNGTLDNSFGTGGVATFAIETESFIQYIAVQPDGKIVASGYVFSYPPDFSYFHIATAMIRLNADGSLDNSFGQNGILKKDHGDPSYGLFVTLQADNKILYTYGISKSSFKYYAERLNTDGSTDNSFGDNGLLAIDGAGLFVQPDQKIIVSGTAINQDNHLQSSISRLNPDGGPDNSFGTNGKVLQSFASGDNNVGVYGIFGNSLFVTGVGGLFSDTAIIAKLTLQSANGISCPAPLVVSTDKNSCFAKVSGIDPAFPAGSLVKYKLTGATKISGNGSASGKLFNKGITTVTYTLNNDATKNCSFTVTVQDKELPVIGNLTVSDAVLWPADHKMKEITVNYSSDDNCGIANIQLSVSSSEVVQSNETGDQSPDWQILDGHHIKLRAERLQSGYGRTYTVKAMITDVSGNQNSKTTTVSVPKTVVPCNFVATASPNPSHGSFLISVVSSCADKITIRILDNKGNVLRTINNLSAPQVLNVGDNLLPGIYYLETSQGSVTKSVKLIKQ